ncbi:MAG TPA: hypothetical protein PLX62_11995 [Bacteroidales bacterium]|jgi:hypothetical protein|nr:hypothetical protein [Bacteroidales bacterium]
MTSSRHNLSNKINDDQLTLLRSQEHSVRLGIEPGGEFLRRAQIEAENLFQPESDKACRARYFGFMKKAGCASQGWK